MNIGTIAKAAGLPTKTVRYYADIGLVTPNARSEAGYRVYTNAQLNKLRFVRSARSFGFSVDECRDLLALYEDRDRSSRDVKRLAQMRISELEEKMTELKTLHAELSRLAASCHGDDRADCPILNGLSK